MLGGVWLVQFSCARRWLTECVPLRVIQVRNRPRYRNNMARLDERATPDPYDILWLYQCL